jgi:hypothetical protein
VAVVAVLAVVQSDRRNMKRGGAWMSRCCKTFSRGILLASAGVDLMNYLRRYKFFVPPGTV